MDVASPSYSLTFTILAKYNGCYFIDCKYGTDYFHIKPIFEITKRLHLTLRKP
jgi:hypothetical protein